MTKKTRAKARRALFTLSLVLVVAFAAVGGTIAWLTDKTDAVTNTFTPTGIDIDLKETMTPDGTDTGEAVTDWEVQLIPNETYTKNPVVSVNQEDDATNVEIYLFVKFEESEGAKNYLDYTSTLTEAKGWKQVDNDVNKNVWYRTVEPNATTTSWELLEENKVTVRNLTNTDMAENDVTLKYTAYAIQTEGFEATDTKTAVQVAWEEVSN